MALAVVAGVALPAAADLPWSARRTYQVQSGGAAAGRALVGYGEHVSIVTGKEPKTGKTVRVRIPLFDELLVEGNRFTFKFKVVPPPRSRARLLLPEMGSLTLTDVRLQGVLLENPKLCRSPKPFKLSVWKGGAFKCPPLPRDYEQPDDVYEPDPCAEAWSSPTEKLCDARFGLSRAPDAAGAPAVHWTEYLGTPLAWEDLTVRALYCHFYTDARCVGQFTQKSYSGNQATAPWALENGVPDVITALAEAGVDINERSLAGREALLEAVENNREEAVRVLLRAGLKVKDLRTDGGESVLMRAAARGNLPIARMLVEAGADPTLKDERGKTARDFAAEAGHTAVAEYLDARARGRK
jgi:hypothetical protein